MEFREVVERRASVRQFANEAMSPDDLREMVRLAGLAPSVNNSQPWRFIAITNRQLLARMAEAVHARVSDMLPDSSEEPARNAKSQVDFFSTFFADAPAVIAVATRPYEAIVDCVLAGSGLSHDDMNRLRGYPDIESVAASIENLLLAAVDLGYGACWLSGPLVARDRLEAILEIEQPWRLAAMVTVGKPGSAARQREKKPVEEILELRE